MKSVRDLQQQISGQQDTWRKRLEEKETAWRLKAVDVEETHRSELSVQQEKVCLEDLFSFY